MGKTMTMTMGPLCSSFGSNLLFMGVALSLLPTTLGYACKFYAIKLDCDLSSGIENKFCVKGWFSWGETVASGCTSSADFRKSYGFQATDGGCGLVTTEYAGVTYVCACDVTKKDHCNDETFGEDQHRKWKEAKDKAKEDEDDKGKDEGGRGHSNSHSSGNGLSNLLQLTFFAALLTLGVISPY